MKRFVLLSLAVLAACGGGSSTTPTPAATPVAAIPSPSPSPVSAATLALEAARKACVPLPSPDKLYGFRVKVHQDQGFKKVMNASPFVADPAYCASIGFGGNYCFTRDEGTAEREPCDIWMAGIDPTSGRPGPKWTFNDEPCRGIGEGGDAPGCRLHPTNPFLAFAFGPGLYGACGGIGTNGSCGTCNLAGGSNPARDDSGRERCTDY